MSRGSASGPLPRVTAARAALAAMACLLLLVGRVSDARARSVPAATSPQDEAIELEVKAAYLFKFSNYVEWPDDAFSHPAQPIVIGVLGANELAAELARLVQGKTVRGHRFTVRRLRDGDDPREVHILFLGDLDRSVVESTLALVGSHHVLTVSDTQRVFAQGTMVNLVPVKQRIRFDVSMPPVQRSRVRLSALMLTAANRVHKGRP
jgi:hypothetical protein